MSYLAICPTGTVFPFAGTTAPNGWLLCNGAAVSRTVYSQLYSVLGTVSGSGDGSTTFNIPDYRGVFLRGVDGGTTRDPDSAARVAMNPGGNTGNNVGSIQGNATSTSLAGSGTNPYTNPNASKSTGGISNNSVTVPTTNISLTHNHTFSGTTTQFYGNGGENSPAPGSLALGAGGIQPGYNWTPSGTVNNNTTLNANHGHTITAGGIGFVTDNETRPKNAYVNYIIKV